LEAPLPETRDDTAGTSDRRRTRSRRT